MHFTTLSLLLLALGICLVSAQTPTVKRASSSKFVTTKGSHFYLNGKPFKFVGTNAYWLHTLNNDQDISDTFANMTATGVSVVRTWGFNDVVQVPAAGTWFALISNGRVTFNNGPNGLPRLDKVVELAEQHNIKLIISLTNNWNPFNSSVPAATGFNATSGTPDKLNRNVLSNDYGGMDAYVRHFAATDKHDEFYTNSQIINLYKNYTTTIVSRYINSPAILGWELANDPRCNSTLPSTNNCKPQTVTKWHSDLAQHVKSVDPNHIVSSGNHGFLCTDCAKLFPTPTPVPTPRTSPAPGKRRRSAPNPFNKRNLLRERVVKRKLALEKEKRSTGAAGGVRIRGRWASTPARRQDTGLGFAYDGSQGVDSQDILGIPQIGFSSFQLFPDQNMYSPDANGQATFNDTVQTGIDWINTQAQSANSYGKPVVITGFGLVTQGNAPNFVPFDSTSVANDSSTSTTPSRKRFATPAGPNLGVTDSQRDDAYMQWFGAGIAAGVDGMLQYQWSQSGLTAGTGTTVTPNSTDTSPDTPSQNPTTPDSNQTGVSPNDGYGTQGVGQDGVNQVITQASQGIGMDASS